MCIDMYSQLRHNIAFSILLHILCLGFFSRRLFRPTLHCQIEVRGMLVFVWVGESLNSLVVFVSDEVARYLLSDVAVILL